MITAILQAIAAALNAYAAKTNYDIQDAPYQRQRQNLADYAAYLKAVREARAAGDDAGADLLRELRAAGAGAVSTNTPPAVSVASGAGSANPDNSGTLHATGGRDMV